MKKRRSRRHSDDEYDEEDSRPGQDDGYRSEGHGRHGDLGKSHDGVDHFDDINNRPRRRRSNPRRHRDDDTRYGHADGYGGRDRRNGAEGVEYGSGVLPLDQRAHPIPPGADPYVAGAAAAAGAAGVQAAQGGMGSPFSDPRSPQQPPSSNHSGGTHPAMASTSTLRGGMATGYVPYAHIYGGPTQPIGQSGFAPSPSDTGSIQPNFLNQVAAPVMPQQNYQQNPYAQEAPLGSQPGYMPDPYWNERQYQDQPSEHRGSRDRRRKDDYESSEESYSPPRRRRSRRSRRDRSSSRDRYSEEDSRRNRRARSERPANGTPVPARGKSQLKGPFDTSSKGLGSSVVGAIAGGLVGSELGKGQGQITGAIGSIIGAIAANAFQARTR